MKDRRVIFAEAVQQTKDELKLRLSPNESLNSNGRKIFVFEELERIGIKDYDALHREFDLIASKQSKLSSSQRDVVFRAYKLVEDNFFYYLKKNGYVDNPRTN